MATKEVILKELTNLTLIFSEWKFQELALPIYLELLEDIPDVVLTQAVKKVMMENKYRQVSIAEIREAAGYDSKDVDEKIMKLKTEIHNSKLLAPVLECDKYFDKAKGYCSKRCYNFGWGGCKENE